MSSQASRSMLCKEVHTITWLQDIVQHELSIDERMYVLLLSKLQTQMTTLDLLEERLNIVRVKAVLWWGFTVIYCEFNDVFCDVPELWKNRCLTFLTQWCNYNKQRQMKKKRISRRVEEHDSAPASNVPQSTEISLLFYTDDKKSEPLKKVQNTMMQVHWNKNHSISCRSQDLLQLRKMKGLIMMNDLNFSKFILMITKKLKYNNQQDMIVYERVDMTTMHIENELKWRTALSEMHTEGSIQFFFAIRRRTERADCEFVDVQHKVIILI